MVSAANFTAAKTANGGNLTVGTAPLVHGWVSSPNGRGTFDIIQICITTVFLCTYSVLYLNARPQYEGLLALLLYKAKWVLFTIFFPEITMGIAAEQWRTAVQSEQDFTSLRIELEKARSDPTARDGDALLTAMQRTPWTTRHAFFADMGGVRLACPDFPAFPVNSYQLLWLVKQRHIPYPELSRRAIEDKNKADIFARCATMLQITWFTVQSVARGIEKLGITTLELSTLAFAFCTLHSFFFWRRKPLDVEEPITLICETKLADIMRGAGVHVGLYKRTPLDFLETSRKLSFIEPWFYSLRALVRKENEAARSLPVSSFSNVDTIPQRGLVIGDVIFSIIFSLSYFGIHLAGWNFPFPTRTERWLWRVSALMLSFTTTLYQFSCWPGNYIGEWMFHEKPIYGTQMAQKIPKWAADLLKIPIIAVYVLSRSYIIVEGFVNLRRLPATAYASIDWWSVLPHL